MGECRLVLGVSLFKCSFSQSDVVVGCSLTGCRRGYLCVVDEAGGEAFIVERAISLRSAVAYLVVAVVVAIIG